MPGLVGKGVINGMSVNPEGLLRCQWAIVYLIHCFIVC